jgi:hypothetical protein
MKAARAACLIARVSSHSDEAAHANSVDLYAHITKRHNRIGTLRTFAHETWSSLLRSVFR